MRRWTRMAVLLAAVALFGMPALALGSTAPATPTGHLSAEPATQIAVLTGHDSVNATDARYDVFGADLGHSFLHGDKIVMVFGDTFGPFQSDWRSNVAAVISDSDPSDGLAFDSMITDAPGHAKELISRDMVPGVNVTIIPTYGVSVGQRMILHFMAVRQWNEPGHWDLNSSGLAYSDDNGQTWTVAPDAVWPGDSNFGQVAIVPSGDFLYFYGIPGGRFGGVQLARVDPKTVLDVSTYDYWTGSGWVRGAAGAKAASTIVPAPVGELSVRWNSHYRKWLMMYLNEHKAAVVLRVADCLTGPWSEETTVATAKEYPQLYAPYILPKWNDGPDIYFTMSLFGPYEVSLMHTSLTAAPPVASTPCAPGT